MGWRWQKKKRRPPRAGETDLMKRDGALALIFVNTSSDGPLADYAGLLTWARQEGASSAAEVARLSELAARDPNAAATAFAGAEDLRDLLSGIFNALVDGEDPRAEDLEAFNSYLEAAQSPRRIRRAADGRGWILTERRAEDLELPLWPVVFSAAEVMTAKKVARCALEGCGVLFVRRNPGSPRKWCGEVCAHRARQRRHYWATVKPYRQLVKASVEAELEARRKARAAAMRAKASGK